MPDDTSGQPVGRPSLVAAFGLDQSPEGRLAFVDMHIAVAIQRLDDLQELLFAPDTRSAPVAIVRERLMRPIRGAREELTKALQR